MRHQERQGCVENTTNLIKTVLAAPLGVALVVLLAKSAEIGQNMQQMIAAQPEAPKMPLAPGTAEIVGVIGVGGAIAFLGLVALDAADRLRR